MRIKLCHAQCEHCGHSDVQDLDLEIHQSPDGKFSLAASCRDELACLWRRSPEAQKVANAS